MKIKTSGLFWFTKNFFGLPNDNDNVNDNGNDNRGIVKGGRRKDIALLSEILSASPFSSPKNGALPMRAQVPHSFLCHSSPLEGVPRNLPFVLKNTNTSFKKEDVKTLHLYKELFDFRQFEGPLTFPVGNEG